jgi:hypothetical protein
VLNLEQTVLCALLDRAPKSKFTQNAMDVFKALLLCGIPFILWSRKAIQSPGLQEELASLVQSQGLLDLSLRVHAHRCQAGLSKLTSKHLTLLWDDPTKPVPSVQRDPLVSPVS